MTTLIFDLETNGLLDEVSTIHCIGLIDADTGAERLYHGPGVHAALTRLRAAERIIGHNIICYDIPVLTKLLGVAPGELKDLRDTLVLSRLAWPDLYDFDQRLRKLNPAFPANLMGRYSLEAWGHRLGVLKGAYGKTTDWAAYTDEMGEYCLQDCRVTLAIWKKLAAKNLDPRSITLEQDFQAVIHQQERNGFWFNQPAAGGLYATLCGERDTLAQQLSAAFPGWSTDTKTPAYYADPLTGAQYALKGEAPPKVRSRLTAGPVKVKHTPFNPASRDHAARALIERYKWNPTVFTNSGKVQVDESVLEGLKYPEAALLCRYYLLEKRIGQLSEGAEGWLRHVRADGRIHGRVTTNGAVTGRCTHSSPNMAQVPSVGSPYGKECRALFAAAPGKVLVGVDASGLELRCLAHYLAKYDDGAYTRLLLTGDVHTANQLAAGLETRNQAKTFIYAWLYGAGDAKIGAIVGKGAGAGRKLKQQFLAANPALKQLKDAVQRAFDHRGHLIGLDGRTLPLRSAHSALNTLLQSAGALIVKKATCLFHERMAAQGYSHGSHYAQVVHVHDEFQVECPGDLSDLVGRQAQEAFVAAGEYFGFRCPIAGEFKVGHTWADTH